jgi:hypothetical protein
LFSALEKLGGLEEALATAQDALAAAEEWRANRGKSQEDLYKEA